MSKCIKENPLVGSKAETKITLDIEAAESRYTGTVEVTYAPDKLILNSLVLVETVRVFTAYIEQEEETIQKVGDTLVELLKPNALYVIMKFQYKELQYKVEVNYEFNKTGKYELRRD